MARGVHTMDFIFNAVLNGGFNGVFSQAQQKFAQLGTEIKNLQSIQRDITSYQKQAQAVTNTATKLQNLQSQQAKVREQIEALKSIQSQDSDEKARNRAQVAALEREYMKYQQHIDDTRAALERKQETMEGLSAKLQNAGVDTNNLGAQSAALTERLKGLEDEQRKVNEELSNGGKQAQEFGEKGENALEAVGSALAAAGIAVAMKEIADGFMLCVNAAGEFGTTMSAVEAIADANEREMAALNAKAKETGLTTVYTAQQSGKAMEYMAMAGWEAQDMLAGMSGMVNLASAAGEELAEVSDIVTDNLTAFNMRADETNHFANVLAKAAAKSNTNIHKMGESFKNSSSVAGALGYRIEDVAVGLGLMANSAVKGTRAGTALRNIFNGFVEGMTLTGQSFGEVEVSAINADGSVKGFMETIRELRGYFSQMTGAEKIQNAMDIAGLRGYNGLLAMVNATDEDFEKLYQEINNCSGAAERMAKIKLDNMQGDLTIAKSAFEGLTIAVGEQFEPELRALYQTGANVFNLTSGFVQEHPTVIKMLAGAAAGIGAVTVAMTGYAAVVKVVKALEVPGLGPAALVAGALGAVFVSTAGAVAETNAQFRDMTKEAIELREALEETGTAYQDTVDTSIASAQAAGEYVDRLRELEQAGKRSSEANSEYQQTLALLVQTMPELEEHVSQTTDEYGRVIYSIKGSTAALYANIEAIKKNAIAQAYAERLKEIYKEYADTMVEAQKNTLDHTKAQERYAKAEAKVIDLEAQLAQAKKESESRGYAERMNGETAAVTELEAALASAKGEMASAGIEAGKYAKAIEMDETAIQEADVALEDAQAAYETLTGTVAGATDAMDENAAKLSEIDQRVSGVLGEIAEMKTSYMEARDAAYESISSQYELWDEAAKRSAIAASKITGNLNGQTRYWKDYTADLDTLMGKVRSGEYDGLGEMIATLTADGSPEAVNAVAGLAKATDKELKDAIQAWQDNKAAVKEASDAMALFVADMETQVGNAAQLVEDMATDIENDMDLGAEAKVAALETIAGYVEGLNEGINSPALNGAMSTLAAKISSAMSGKVLMGGVYNDFENSTRKKPLMQGVYSDWDHYAGGTGNAAPGWAVVGENGPEAIHMRGGEEVIPATRTAGMLAGGKGQSVYNITLKVEGSVNEETTQRIKRAVFEAIEEIEEDKQRRGYN